MIVIDADDLEQITAGLMANGAIDDDLRVRRIEFQRILDGMHRMAAKQYRPINQLRVAVAALIAGFSFHKPLRLGSFDGPPAEHGNLLVGLHAARLLGYLNGHALLVTSTDDEFLDWWPRLTGTEFNGFVDWIATRTWPDPDTEVSPTQLHLFHDKADLDTALLLEPRVDHLPGVKAYLCSALTNQSPEALREIEDLSDRASAALSASGISCHQPILHTHPERHAGYTPREIHDRDVTEVLDADLIVLIANSGSTGAGKELAYSERLRGLQLILAPEGRAVSRLVLGATADVTVHRYQTPEEIGPLVARFLADRADDLRARRDARLRRAVQYDLPFRTLADRIARRGLDAAAQDAGMTPDRLAEIIGSTSAFAAASVDEYLAVTAALLPHEPPTPEPAAVVPPSRPRLGDREILALEDAAEIKGWDEATCWEILTIAREALAQSGTRRLRFASPRDWIDFWRDHRG